MLFYQCVTCHRGVFFTFWTASSSFRGTPIRAHTAGGQTLLFPPNGHPPPLLAAISTPPHPAVIFHTSCLQFNSLLHTSGQTLPHLRPAASFTPAVGHPHPSPPSGHGGQTVPSPPSGHPPPLLTAIFFALHLAVMAVKLYPATQRSWWSNSPLPTQRSSSTPAGGQPHPSPPLGVRVVGGG